MAWTNIHSVTLASQVRKERGSALELDGMPVRRTTMDGGDTTGQRGNRERTFRRCYADGDICWWDACRIRAVPRPAANP